MPSADTDAPAGGAPAQRCAGGIRNEYEQECNEGGGAQASRKLLAALAVMAVAFVVLAAVPSIATDSDAANGPTEGVIAAGYASDATTATALVNALGGFSIETKNVAPSTVFMVFHIDGGKYNKVEYSRSVDGTVVETPAASAAQTKAEGTFSAQNAYYMFTVQKDVDTATNADSIAQEWSAEKTYTLTVTLSGPNNASKVITADVKGAVVTLYQDVTVSSSKTTSIDVVVDNGKTESFTSVVPVVSDLEIRLNGNDLTFDKTSAAFFVGDLDNENTVTLKIVGNQSEQKDKLIVGYAGAAVFVASQGAFEIDNIDFDATGSAIFPYGNASSVVVSESDVTAGGYGVATNNAYSNNSKLNIDIISSKVVTKEANGDSTAVLINISGATLNIKENSIIEGQRQTLIVRAGIATVEKSEINFGNSFKPYGTGADSYYIGTEKDWADGNRITEGAIVVGNKTSSAYAGLAKLTMVGGSINAVSGKAIVTTVASDENHSVDVVIGKDSPTTIACGAGADKASIVVSDLRYNATSEKNPTTPLMISKGSVVLGGTLDEVKIVDGEATVSSDLTIADGGRLVLAEGATVTVKEGAKIVLNDADDLVIDENAKLVLEEDAQIMKGTATVYIPGTINRVGGTEYVVNVATFDGKYTVYYGVATQPMAYTGKEIKDGDVVGSATILQCLKKDGTDLTTGTSIDVANIVINDSVSGKVLTPETYPGAVTFTVTIKIQDTKGNSYVNKTDADILVTKADLSKATATIEPLTYDGTNQTPEYSLTFNGEAVDDIAVKYYPDKSCTTEVMVCNAGTYYAKFTATADNELFAGEKVVEFKVEKAASGAFGYDVAKTDREADYYWTAHAYDGNVIVDINDASGIYRLYTATALKADGTPDYGASATFADQTAFDNAIKAIDSVQSAAYTIYLKVEVSDATNYKDETVVIEPISVGDVAFKITVSKAGNGTVGAPKYCQAGTEVVLVVTPSEGWKLGEGFTMNYVLDGATINENVVDNRFIMPAADVELKVVFVQQYTVEFADGVDVEAERTGEVVSKETYVDAGERITVSVPAGMRFDGEPVVKYTVSGTEKTADLTLSDGAYTFVMPAADVKITFRLVGDLKVVLVEDGYKDLVFEGLADGEMFDLPFPADHDFWTVGEDVEKYNGGSIYIVDKDHAEDGVITFTATDAPEDPVIEYVTVTFVYGLKGEHTYSLDVVKDGAIGIFPAAAVIDGYTLSWTSNGAPVSETDVATEDMIVVASYEAIPPVEPGEEIVKVTFRYGEDTTIVEIKKGTAVGMTPADAVKDGYTLKWMVGEVEFNEKDQISEDTVVTAAYTPIVEPEVQYSTNMVVALKVVDGKIYYTIVALDGKVVPAGTMKIEYQFFDGFSYDKETLGTVEISGGSSVIVGTMNIPTDKTISKFFAEFSFGENAESAILFV